MSKVASSSASTSAPSKPFVQTKSKLRCYWELTRLHLWPAGNILVFWPCAWALAMAAHKTNLPPQSLAIETFMFALGSTLLHSAACVINDICDIDFDKQVERTKNRPLAAGYIPVSGAWILLAALTAASIAPLFWTNQQALYWGLFGVFPLHAFYPLMKRVTYWPQAYLGLAMNWGFPVAWLVIDGTVQKEIFAAYIFGCLAWTIVYDTIYACQDRKDDSKAGVKSTALFFGDWVRPILVVFAAFFVGTMYYAGVVNNQGPAYFYLAVGGAAAHFAWQFITWKVDDPADCWRKFAANGDIGYIIWAGMLVDYYQKVVAPTL